ncbi:helix-turn-helix domain-containing protein [Hyalangium rubrum]|uniref:Helix-turn-helix transcriptional regulator n=1 Tax=Hyalangium rubrum TaxID=3103134 RepID=A0ABU5HCZ6_9BACT|nr:helix-turn-helix transcriptional regulator [Hyalangium sp. s54d21]MDY7231334.1 helix-turn-helix transcriptional regulator [Hyalangium sp. s54d21]
MERPLPPGSRVLLVAPEARAPGSAPVGELIIDGQRYHLVPAPFEEPTPTAVPLPDARVLTARELQIVACVAAGQVNKQIAAELKISTWTVAAHLRRIFSKLGVETRAAMVSRCFGASSVPRAP